MKRCPQCHRPMLAEGEVKCRYCGADLKTSGRKRIRLTTVLLVGIALVLAAMFLVSPGILDGLVYPLISMTKQQRTAKEEVAPKKDFHAEDIYQRYLNKYRVKPGVSSKIDMIRIFTFTRSFQK